MVSLHNNDTTYSHILADKACQIYFVFPGETSMGYGFRAFFYFLALAYCFIGLSAITESFPQISLATIDAIRNIGKLYAGGLGPGTLVGSAAFDLFPIHAVCVVVPKAGEVKKISDLGVWIVELFWSFWAYIWLYIILEVWSPNVIAVWEALFTVMQFGLLLVHAYAQDKRWPFSLMFTGRELKDQRNGYHQKRGLLIYFSIHQENELDSNYQHLPQNDPSDEHFMSPESDVVSVWKQQFVDALTLDSRKLRLSNKRWAWGVRVLWNAVFAPWKLVFAFVPPYQIAHGWIAFICSLMFISGIAYIVTRLTDLISCVTGINGYVIAFTALASGTSWPDLVASKIAAERQTTADSAIANITCSNSVNIYVGIGVPWLIDTAYNFIA
ncbi:hypothetical protein LXL04_001156 [Taraxacum kok-saghyz]